MFTSSLTLFIRILSQLPFPGIDKLKESKIGRQCMFLYKHPRETEENKKHLWKLIEKWARPIHNRVDSYAHLKPEDREAMDLEAAAALPRRLSTGSAAPVEDKNLKFVFLLSGYDHRETCSSSELATTASYRVPGSRR